MDCIVHGVAKSQIQLNEFHLHILTMNIERNGYPLQYSGLENSMNCIVHGVAKSWTRLSDFHFHSLVAQMVKNLPAV